MENSVEDMNKKSEDACGCKCHNQCGFGAHKCCGCGLGKGLIAGVLLCLLIFFIADRVCSNHMMRCSYNGSSIIENTTPDTK
jgi:hypothetical protein